MGWSQFLTILHIIGTVLGVGGATFAEIFAQKALKDGHIDSSEGAFLKATYTAMRIGMVLLLLSGFGYFILFRLTGREELLYLPRFWAKMTITFIILFNAVLLQTRKIPFWLGSAISLTSWYAALVLGVLRGLKASYITIMVWYVVAVMFVAFVIHIIKLSKVQRT